MQRKKGKLYLYNGIEIFKDPSSFGINRKEKLIRRSHNIINELFSPMY